MADATTSRLTWLGHAAVRIETSEGKVIYIDPWLDADRGRNQEDTGKFS